MPKGLKGRDQTKSHTMVLQVESWAKGQKTLTFTKTVSIDEETTLMRGVVAGAATTIWSQNQSEAQSLIGPHSSLQATDNHWLLECEDHGGHNTGRASS